MAARWTSLLLVLAFAGCGDSKGPVTIAVRADSELADAPVRIDVRGLGSDGRAMLRARWTASGGTVWTSSTALRAGGDGTARLRGVDGMRFLWAMRPERPTGSLQRFDLPASGASTVALAVEAGGRTVARASLARRVAPASVRRSRLTVRRDGVSGILFTPRASASRPGVLVFGGSEGGNAQANVAGLLAAHGYPTLALAYFKAPGLPSRLKDVPLEYFARAARVLRRRQPVDPERVVTLGGSRGGEASLLVASKFPELIHGAIGLVPSSVAAGALDAPGAASWTYRGRPVEPLTPIAVERIGGPVLTAGGRADNVWSSANYVDQIEQRLSTERFGFDHEGRVYEGAGHRIGGAIPYLPTPTDLTLYGGEPAADAAATADLWPRILRYLEQL